MVATRDAAAGTGFPLYGWFGNSPPEFRHDVLALARPKSLAAGTVFYQAGDRGPDVYGVVSGVVTLQGRFPHPDAALLHMVHPGEWFGTTPVLFDQAHLMTATARTDAEVLRIPGDELRTLLRRRPEWYCEFAQDAVYSLDLAMQGAADLLIRDAAARCAAVLLRLARRRWEHVPDGNLPGEIPASQAEIAMLCNVSRNTFSRVINEFAARRLLTIHYRSTTVHDPARLRTIANGG
jgi:CRP-like cAMP-binding protein